MTIIELAEPESGCTARIAVDRGCNCFDLQIPVRGERISVLSALPGFETGAAKASSSGIPILFPFPNRIRQGRFHWAGRDYQLPVTDKFGNAIHGFCLDRPWSLVEQGPSYCIAEFQLSRHAPDRRHLWPTDFIIEVNYELLPGRLRANFRISNPTNEPLPWGLGTHPYFQLPLGAQGEIRDCLIEVPATRRWELQDCLPTGELLELDDDSDLLDGRYADQLQLDDVFTALDYDGPQFDCVITDERAGIQVIQTSPPIFREVVVFTPPNRPAICLEPYTCPTNAIELTAAGRDVGWRVLGPGSEFHTWIDITAGPVLV